MRNDLSSPDLPLYTNRNRVGEVERKRPNSTDLTKTDISIARATNRVYLVKAKYARILEILRDSQIQNERYSALRITDSINTSIRKFRKNVIARDTTSSNSR